MNKPPRIAIIIPCYNEEQTIGGVVHAFRDELPDATR
jgi:glycosyltransferase involved in cell wall biosynthesis